MVGVSLYVNTGSTPNLATNETTIGTYSSTVLSFSPNQTIYIVVVSSDVTPVLNFTYRFYQVAPPVVVPTCNSS